MKSNGKFTQLENVKEIESHVKGLTVIRDIQRIQLHHMGLPDYDCYEQDLKRWGKNAELNRTNSLDSYGKNTWNSGDGKGHYIAQHFNIFPNGHITTGRDINSTPIGIKGWNTGAICIEIYGNFDRGKDVMTKAQMISVIALVGALSKKLKLAISSNYIRCHCWFTASGTYLGGYSPGKSAKSCPGTEFTRGFGGLVNSYGNSKDAIDKYVFPQISKYLKDGISDGNLTEVDKTPTVPKPPKPTIHPGKYIVRYLQSCLNDDYNLNLAEDGSFGPASQKAVDKHYLNEGDKGEHVIWLQKALNNRGFKLTVDGVFGPTTLKQLKDYQKSRGLKPDGCGGSGTHKAIIND
ncbi:MAG: peptidoglycan recognition protein family protein [Sarcina sp.]